MSPYGFHRPAIPPFSLQKENKRHTTHDTLPVLARWKWHPKKEPPVALASAVHLPPLSIYPYLSLLFNIECRGPSLFLHQALKLPPCLSVKLRAQKGRRLETIPDPRGRGGLFSYGRCRGKDYDVCRKRREIPATHHHTLTDTHTHTLSLSLSLSTDTFSLSDGFFGSSSPSSILVAS
ncbi:hypothetical protein Cob_v002979 [Colletotrichum orbiculare MAFF 240422]|uniref:Uncharacterized protein n=1 Tax=Colletotrichum orbiculare (strain 104-T / ATCC 96160 / CBS 514.97 / LARS 414 / MAFF 240422) TaxID=1213857 RepID=A0A484G3W4_COLOR|nr:hypothetical protein Cob_v002979 [Colletotrichum orbiculare MAFF 240422]